MTPIKPTSISFIGRKQNISKQFEQTFSLPHQMERPRLNEENGFSHSNLVKENNLDCSDIVYIRINPEQVNAKSLKKILNAQNKINPDAWIINDAASFNKYADKADCFNTWSDQNIPCPEFQSFSPWSNIRKTANQILTLAQKNSGQYIRTSNEDSGKGLHYISSNSSLGDIKKTLRKLRLRCLTNRVSNSRILSVSPIKFDTQSTNHVFRAHIVGKEIIGGYALTSESSIVHTRDLKLSDWDAFLDYNEIFQKLIKNTDHNKQILKACNTLGVTIGAVEFFLVNNQLIFLEVNPMWGGHHKFGNPDFMELLHKNIELPQLSYVKKWLNSKQYYTDLYNEIEKQYQQDHKNET